MSMACSNLVSNSEKKLQKTVCWNMSMKKTKDDDDAKVPR